MATTRVHSRYRASDAPEGLVALVRLLARQAAREAVASIESLDTSATSDKTQPMKETME